MDKNICQEIMTEIPTGDDRKARGVALIANTLKAFYYFYQYTIGVLSIAVVDPVLNFISKLEEINVNNLICDKSN